MAMRGISPNIRFMMIEELDLGGAKALSEMKRICDGVIRFRENAGSDMVEYKMNAKMIVTSNFKIDLGEADSGILRRALYYEY